MQMSRTRIRIVPTRTVRTRTAQIVRTVLHLHRRIVERTKIPTIKILLIRMDIFLFSYINLIYFIVYSKSPVSVLANVRF